MVLKISKAEFKGIEILSAYVSSTSLNAQFSKSQGEIFKFLKSDPTFKVYLQINTMENYTHISAYAEYFSIKKI